MNAFIGTIVYFFISIVIVLIGLFIFENITRKYKDYEEIKNGNVAVSLSVSGKIIGICLILAFAIYNSAHIYDTIIWGLVGVVLQMVAYVIVELLTRTFSIEEQLKNNNIAVGILSMSVSIGLGFVIGASIT
jgi:putative membrane protein